MARPKLAPDARKVLASVDPPPDLHPVLRELWDEEFSRFPSGWFVPADLRSMKTYVELVWRYRQISALVDDCLSVGRIADKTTMVSLNQATAQMTRMQANLRMHPSTRVSRERSANMATDAGKQAEDPNAPTGWRNTMAQAVAAQSNNVTKLPVAKRGPGRPRKVDHAAH